MPLPGGPADKFGNRYEGRWTVYWMLRILDEQALAIHLEPVGEVGEGVEFFVTLGNGTREFHQVKRQHGGGGTWTISLLHQKRVLPTFQSKLADPSARCVFVSMTSADQLRELVERACKATDVDGFQKEFLKAKEPQNWFNELRRNWGSCTPETAYEALCRIRVDTITEHILDDYLQFYAAALIIGDAANVVDILAELALASIHRELNAEMIWAHLQERAFQRRVWNRDPHIRTAVEAANERYLDSIRHRAILGKHLNRDEARVVMAKLEAADGKRAVLLSGDAGCGKSGVVAEVMELAQSRGWPVLALRMDRLDPAQTARQLGEQLDLPESPAIVLAGVAAKQRCLLVIDQLDAVSKSSGRHPAFFERVEELIRQSEASKHIRLVLSCRAFDLANDDRLRRLIGEQGMADEVKIGRLPVETVRNVVREYGVDPGGLNAVQEELLSVPLHLKIFTEISGTDSLRFRNLNDLYDLYWEHKQDATRERLGRSLQWNELLDAALARMMQDQSLSVPAKWLGDQFNQDLRAFVSEGVMVQEGQRLSFFHETFFDYAFARRFVGGGKRLLPFLRSREQDLFLRATVRQILTYERAEEFSTYIEDLRELLHAEEIRFHLKRLVCTWLRALPDPRPEEWDVLSALTRRPDADIAREAWEASTSPSWFRLLDSMGFIRQELESQEEERVERMVRLLVRNVRELPERVAEIALSFVDRSEPWPQRAWEVLSWSNACDSYQFIKLYKRLMAKGVIPEQQNPFSVGSSRMLFHDLPGKHPDWAVEVFEIWLFHVTRKHERCGKLNPFGHERSSTRGALDALARAVPGTFVQTLLPYMLELVRRNARRQYQGRAFSPPWIDTIWSVPLYGYDLDLGYECLNSMITALKLLAEHPSDVFARYARDIRQYLDFQTAGFLLAHAYAANGLYFAEEAASFCLATAPGWSSVGATRHTGFLARSSQPLHRTAPKRPIKPWKQ